MAHTGTRVQGLPEHMGDALKNKPSFGQSGFRWFGCSSKASSSLGQLIISMDARRWCSQVWRTSIKRPGSLAHGSRLQSHLSDLKMTEARPVAVSTGPSVPLLQSQRLLQRKGAGSEGRKKKKKTRVNWIRLCRGNPRPDQEKKKRRRKRKKNYSKMPGFARARGRKDRCLISFSVRATGLRGVDLWGGRLLVFALCQSVCVCAEKYFWLFFFSETERSVINISRLSKQKQTIKLTSRIKVWKQSLFFPSLSYFFWTVSSDSSSCILLV